MGNSGATPLKPDDGSPLSDEIIRLNLDFHFPSRSDCRTRVDGPLFACLRHKRASGMRNALIAVIRALIRAAARECRHFFNTLASLYIDVAFNNVWR